jgi:nucleoside-diphosphate-sugar epimerase
MSKIILTGCAGFIGSNILLELMKTENQILGIDNLSTGLIDNVQQERFVGLPGKFEFVKTDICDENLVRYFEGYDYCLHLAALARVQLSIDLPIETNRVNVGGTLNVLEAARKAGLKKVVFSSSSSIFGGTSQLPTPETATPNPLSPYSLHKLTGEYYCRLFSQLHGLDTVCLRYFNVCGSGQRTGENVAYATVIPAFMDKAVNGGICVINGNGEISRDFCPVENIVSANVLAMQHPAPLKGEVFSIACGQTTTINQVYDRICELAGFQVPKTHGPPRQGDPAMSMADITKAQEVLGYKVLVGLDESLAKTWEWWKGGCK